MDIEIELRPKHGELRPQYNPPGGPATRENILEFDPNSHTLVNIRRETVQYGTVEGNPAALIILRFIIKFRTGHKRLRSFHVEIDFHEHGAPPTSKVNRTRVIALAPEEGGGRIFTTDRIISNTAQEKTQEGIVSKQSNKEHEVKLMGWKRSSGSGMDNVAVWDCSEGRKAAKGLIPDYRAAIIVQYPEKTTFQARIKLDADRGVFIMDSGLFDWLKVFGFGTDDPVIFNPTEPVGKQYPINDFKDLSLTDIIMSQPILRLPKNPPQNERFISITYRVSQIPSQLSKTSLQNLLCPGNPSGVYVGSLAAAADYMDTKLYQVATVRFQENQSPFTGKRPDKPTVHTFKQDQKDVRLIVDIGFIGLTTLASPMLSQDVTVDIVAVTGLGGHGFGSWKERGGEFMWLRDALPHDFPNARILTFGYDSHLQDSSSFASISDYGRVLLAEVVAARQESFEATRPLIFIGHSLGGLVLKEALVEASRGRESENNVINSTIGILFFGVPHHGLRSEELESVVQNKPNETTIESLKPESPYLNLLDRSFRELNKSRPWKIWSFWETKVSSTVKEVGGKLTMNGPKVILVPKSSANACTEERFQYPVDRTHSDMVKFEEGSQDYRRTRDSLKELYTEVTNTGPFKAV